MCGLDGDASEIVAPCPVYQRGRTGEIVSLSDGTNVAAQQHRHSCERNGKLVRLLAQSSPSVRRAARTHLSDCFRDKTCPKGLKMPESGNEFHPRVVRNFEVSDERNREWKGKKMGKRYRHVDTVGKVVDDVRMP